MLSAFAPPRFFSSATSGTRDLYLALLGSHKILAVVIVPLILTTVSPFGRAEAPRGCGHLYSET